MSRRRVVITGLGAVSAVGNTVAENWDAISNGRSGIGLISDFDTQSYGVKLGGEVKGLDVEAYIPKKEARRMDRFVQYGIIAAEQAISDAGLEVGEAGADMAGVALAAGIGGIINISKNVLTLEKGGPRKVSPFFVPSSIINMIAGHVSINHNLRGPNLAVVTACTTGTHNIGLAARLIQYGDADVMVAGGAEAAIAPVTLAGFSSMRALSSRNDDPAAASRPWDADRDGFVLGDGGGAVVLEEYEHAKARGATIYAELAGFGMSGDAHHITAPAEDGAGACLAMSKAIKDAGINVDQVDYINAHGTSTGLGDVAETKAIRKVLGDHANRVAVSSTKSMVGHLLGGAGAVEAVYSILALRDQLAPPTINLDNPGEGCDLDYVPNIARDMPIEYVLSNSFGFGGTNGSLVFKRAQ